MGINSVSFIAPRQEQREPQEKKKDWVEKVMEGLQIAKGITGITSDYQTIMKAREDRDALADTRSGILTGKDRLSAQVSGLQPVAAGTAGAVTHKFRAGDDVKEEAFILPKKKEAEVAIRPPTSRTRPDGIMEEWDPNTKVWNKVAEKPPEKAKNPRDEQYDALTKPEQQAVNGLTDDAVKKTSIATMIDSQLANLRKSWESGNTDLAITQGKEMLKVLNSDQGKDAVGAEEAARLGSFLEYKIANFTGPGSFVGRDVDQFYTQAAERNNAIKAAIKSNQKMVEDIYAGKGIPQLADTNTKLPEQGGAGTATAAPGSAGGDFTPRRQKSPKDGKWYRETAPDQWALDANQKG